ncbi:hypothetical protein F4808DRAFT_431473 [Astrocystis sublimbata]|nr:hypothetical protein F4808DRAFT_431473 [Astrocystis sublimbata]
MEACCPPEVLSSLFKTHKMLAKTFCRKKKTGSLEQFYPNEKLSQNGPPSPNYRLLKLKADVTRKYSRGDEPRSQQFLPNDQLKELVTKDTVLLALQETTIEQQYHEDLASWVLQRGMRLFLILVLLTQGSAEQLSSLRQLKSDGVNDDVLPLGFSTTNEPFYGYSLAPAPAEHARKFHSFKTWDDNDLVLFEGCQWKFLAPVFGASNKFRHHINIEQPLPFMNLSKKPEKGILGETVYGEIHPAHMDSRCLSALGKNHPGLQGIPVFIKLVQHSDNLKSLFDIDTGKFTAAHPIIPTHRIRPIAAYKRSGDDFVIFQWVDGDSPSK